MLAAFRGEGGKWNKNINVPPLAARLIARHPFFLADVIGFKFRKIFTESLSRMRSYKDRIRICQK